MRTTGDGGADSIEYGEEDERWSKEELSHDASSEGGGSISAAAIIRLRFLGMIWEKNKGDRDYLRKASVG